MLVRSELGRVQKGTKRKKVAGRYGFTHVHSIAGGFNTWIGEAKDDTSTVGTCVVADRAEAIDGQAAAQGGQHAQGRQRNAVEIAELERDKNGLSSLAAWSNHCTTGKSPGTLLSDCSSK